MTKQFLFALVAMCASMNMAFAGDLGGEIQGNKDAGSGSSCKYATKGMTSDKNLILPTTARTIKPRSRHKAAPVGTTV